MIIKFINKESNSKSILSIILTILGITILFDFLDLRLGIGSSVIYFLLTLSYFLQSFIFSKKLTKGVKEIEINDSLVKVTFFNSFKSSLSFLISDIIVTVNDNELRFFKKGNSKLLAIAYKKLLIEKDDWDKAILLLKSSSIPEVN
jgi:hypothetical protein